MLRVERKYLVPYHKMDLLRERFMPFVNTDKYAIKSDTGIFQYTVRSIYFDSKDFICYTEKKEGLPHRRKFRIRGYNDLNDENNVVMEIKRKIHSRQKKYRSVVSFGNVEDLLKSGDLEKFVIVNGCKNKALTDAGKFMFHIKKRQFIPTCLISYEREAYVGKMDPGVRVTFDKNVRSRLYPSIDSLFSEEMMKPLFHNHFVLEIKYFRKEMPLWARAIVQEFKLRNDAISKYSLGVDVNKEKYLLTF
jgi:hypothetical protein